MGSEALKQTELDGQFLERSGYTPENIWQRWQLPAPVPNPLQYNTPCKPLRAEKKGASTAPRSAPFSPERTENPKTLLLTARIAACGDQTGRRAKSRDLTPAKRRHLTRSYPAPSTSSYVVLGRVLPGTAPLRAQPSRSLFLGRIFSKPPLTGPE